MMLPDGCKSVYSELCDGINSNRTRKIETTNGITEAINYEYNANDQLLSEASSVNDTTIYNL